MKRSANLLRWSSSKTLATATLLLISWLSAVPSFAIFGCLVPDEELEAAIPSCDLIFVGMIQDQSCEYLKQDDHFPSVGVLQVKVLEVLKGPPTKTVTLTGVGAACGEFGYCDDTRYQLVAGNTALLFVRRDAKGAMRVVGHRFPQEESVDRWKLKVGNATGKGK